MRSRRLMARPVAHSTGPAGAVYYDPLDGHGKPLGQGAVADPESAS